MTSASYGALGTFAGYELIEVLGNGGMAVVYHARSLESGQEVALKMLPGGKLLSKETRQRFVLEERITSSLTHTGILPVYDRGEIHGTLYFTMKLAPGGTLAEHKKEYAGQWQRIAELMARIADVVQHAHDNGVVHRDLKPANILLDEEGNPYVCDFGIAKTVEEDLHLTQAFTQMGTPHYMSPEMVQVDGEGPSPLSDVWSLGVIMYELLASRRPFTGDSPAQVMRNVEEDSPPPLRQVPRALAPIATTALSKRPAARYASAHDMAEDLRRWLRSEPILAKPQPWTQVAWPWLRRHSAVLTMLAMLISTAVTVLSLGDQASHSAQSTTSTDLVTTAASESIISAQVPVVASSLRQPSARNTRRSPGPHFKPQTAGTVAKARLPVTVVQR